MPVHPDLWAGAADGVVVDIDEVSEEDQEVPLKVAQVGVIGDDLCVWTSQFDTDFSVFWKLKRRKDGVGDGNTKVSQPFLLRYLEAREGCGRIVVPDLLLLGEKSGANKPLLPTTKASHRSLNI